MTVVRQIFSESEKKSWTYASLRVHPRDREVKRHYMANWLKKIVNTFVIKQ
jgi:hypothetical protein